MEIDITREELPYVMSAVRSKLEAARSGLVHPPVWWDTSRVEVMRLENIMAKLEVISREAI